MLDDGAGILRVMVVDDCPDTRKTLRILLELWGHQVRDASDGPSALREAAGFIPDVVLLDLAMPGMGGIEVAQRIRHIPGLSGVLLIAATGFGRPEDVEQSKAAGFDHHLTKPFDPADLKRLLSFRCSHAPA